MLTAGPRRFFRFMRFRVDTAAKNAGSRGREDCLEINPFCLVNYTPSFAG